MTGVLKALPVLLLATLLPCATAWAQPSRQATGRFAAGVSVGTGLLSNDDGSERGPSVAVSAEMTVTPGWFVRAQYGAGPVDRFTLGLARSFAHLRPRAFLSAEGGFGTVKFPTWKSGVYAGAGMQVPIGASPLALAADGKLYVLSEHVGVAFLVGLKVHF